MKKENVITIRDTFKTNKGFGIRVIMDNMQILDSKNHFIFWDDTDELIIGIRVNNTQFRNEAPMEIIVSEYEHIQYLITGIPDNGFDRVISNILPGIDAGIAQDKIKNIIDYYHNEVSAQAIVPNKDFARTTNPMSIDGTKPGKYSFDQKWVKVVYVTDTNLNLFEQNVLADIVSYNYAPAARNQADMYAMSVGKRFDSWDKSEQETLQAIKEATPKDGKTMGLVTIRANFKL